MYPEVTKALLDLRDFPLSEIKPNTIKVLERFVIILYDRTSEHDDLNICRKQLFAKRSCTLELLPPTSDAFMLHVKRAMYQAVLIWGQCLIKIPEIYNPCSWGWKKTSNKFSPIWMTKPQVSLVLSELINCKCKKGCTGRCKCVKANLACTALCGCDGECVR